MKVEFPKINNKLAFFDFDRTLVKHTYSLDFIRAKEGEDGYLMECVYMLSAMEEEYANDRPLPCMQWYVKKLFEEGYGLYCLTHEIFNLRNRFKKSQLDLFYPDTPMTYLTTDTPEHKIDMIKAVAMAEACSLSDIIFVDDLMPTVYLAQKEGIDAKHLSDIVEMYESRKLFEQQDFVLSPDFVQNLKKEEAPKTNPEPPKTKEKDEASISEMEMNRICREYWNMSDNPHDKNKK